MVIQFLAWKSASAQFGDRRDQRKRAPHRLPPTKRAEARIHELESRIAGVREQARADRAELRATQAAAFRPAESVQRAPRRPPMQAAFARHPDAVPSAAP